MPAARRAPGAGLRGLSRTRSSGVGMADFLDTVQRRVLLFDGAMGTQIHARDLSVEADFWGKENCSEVLNLARPDVIADIHLGYLRAGADAPARTCCRSRRRCWGSSGAMRAEGRRGAGGHPRHRRDHRHDAAGQRDRRGADGDRAAGRRPDRAELRHRSGRDERAPAHAGQARPDPAVGDAERRPAGAGPTRRGVPARPGRAGRGARRVRPRLRAAAGRRLLRHDPGARPRRRRRDRGR